MSGPPPSIGAIRPRIQAGGALLAAEGPDAPLRFVAGEVASWLGAAPETLLGESLAGRFDAPSARRLRACWNAVAVGEAPAALELRSAAAATRGVAWLHRNSQGFLLLEWEPREESEGFLPSELARRLAEGCRKAPSSSEALRRLACGARAATGASRALVVDFSCAATRIPAEDGAPGPTDFGDDGAFLAALEECCGRGSPHGWGGVSNDGAEVVSDAPEAGPPLDLQGAVLRLPPEAVRRGLRRWGAESAAAVALEDERGVWGCLLFLDAGPKRLSPDWRLALGGIGFAAAIRRPGAEAAPIHAVEPTPIKTVEPGPEAAERGRMRDSLQAALTEAEAASQAKSRFLANMSHELRTPMNAILGLTDLALASNLTDDQRVDLQIVKESGQALLRLLDDLLDFARLEGRTVALRNVPFSIRNCLQRLCRTLAPHGFNKGLDWVCDLASSLPEQAIGDEGRFEQLVRNLLDNALKYTQEGSVELRAWAERTALDRCMLHCEIRDTGPGIPVEDQERIFEVFTQLDSTLRRRSTGAGLGLAICRELARVLGGRLELRSEEGVGSRFTASIPFGLLLPAGPIAAAALAVEPGPPPVSSTSGGPPMGLLASPSPAAARIFLGAAARFDARLEAADSLDAAQQRQQILADAGTPASFAFLDEALYAQASPDQLRRFAAGFPAGAVALVGRFGLPRRSGEVPLADLRIEKTVLLPILDAEFQPILRALQKAGAAPPKTAAASSSADGERPLQVLLAEDTLANQRVIVRFLERRGHKVVTALHGREALDRMEEKRFDLVLMDVQMPVMDGLTATREIRKREQAASAPATPVIAITAHAFPEERPFFLEAGLDDVLVKPVNFAQMDALLQRIRRDRLDAPAG